MQRYLRPISQGFFGSTLTKYVPKHNKISNVQDSLSDFIRNISLKAYQQLEKSPNQDTLIRRNTNNIMNMFEI